ncbi:protein unc-13 homolog A-like [Rhinatrema bivittatum]|uniref:protein unc-13 homolog A-like n=1 Tax=Rhinatrema bivittatum TaxID=194408 RepID=UPI00112C6CEF|nr:protein unc-13 homolog A-like [Rhinatrema bivittatum]
MHLLKFDRLQQAGKNTHTHVLCHGSALCERSHAWPEKVESMNCATCMVKEGKLHKATDTYNTYIVLKVHNLKSTTVTRGGSKPRWEQDYIFEIQDTESCLSVELWRKGWLRDTLLGTISIPLQTVQHAIDEGTGEWWPLHSEIIRRGNEINTIKALTTHEILLDVYFALLSGNPQYYYVEE